MKLSISITFLILAIGGIFGWHGQARLLETRETLRLLVTEAGMLGISIDRSNPAGTAAARTKGPRENRDETARQLAIDLIAMTHEADALRKEGKGNDPEMRKNYMEMKERWMALDPSQLTIVIAALRENQTLGEESRREVVASSIMLLSSNHPKAALALFTESSELLAESMIGKELLSTSLKNWAKDDPHGAIDWLRINAGKYPDLANDESKEAIIAGAASNNPTLAYSLIAELDFERPHDAVGWIVHACNTPAERTAAMMATREFLHSAEPETRDNMITSFFSELGSEVSLEEFDKAAPWISGAKLSPAEMESFSDGFYHHSLEGETGKWIDWMSENLRPEKAIERTENLIKDWTRKDFNAAGTWISATEDGPVKTAAIRTYAETVAVYEPETAAQWALTLPAGKDRDATLESIHKKWPENDAEGKAAFAEQHGINK